MESWNPNDGEWEIVLENEVDAREWEPGVTRGRNVSEGVYAREARIDIRLVAGPLLVLQERDF